MIDGTSALIHAIRAFFANFITFSVEEIRSRSWASVTFTGARHELAFRISGAGADQAAERFVANLGAAEFDLRGHILADIALVEEERGRDRALIRVEALTVEDA
jgi:hypothetical protein